MTTKHTVSSFDEGLAALRAELAEMGDHAGAMLDRAVAALVAADREAATGVIRDDKQLDDAEARVEETALRVLALHHPVANDLREVLAAQRTAGDLERIGDFAKNTAKRALAVKELGGPDQRFTGQLEHIGELASGLVREAMSALEARNTASALAVWHRDLELDDAYSRLFQDVLRHMSQEQTTVSASTHLLFVAKNLERVGDHVTNIAELAYFLITGERLESVQDRPKGDTSAFTVVDADGRSHTVEPTG